MNSDHHPDRHLETLEPGKKVAFCRCWKSKTFPYCDGSHRQIKPHDNEGPLGPVVVNTTTD